MGRRGERRGEREEEREMGRKRGERWEERGERRGRRYVTQTSPHLFFFPSFITQMETPFNKPVFTPPLSKQPNNIIRTCHSHKCQFKTYHHISPSKGPPLLQYEPSQDSPLLCPFSTTCLALSKSSSSPPVMSSTCKSSNSSPWG